MNALRFIFHCPREIDKFVYVLPIVSTKFKKKSFIYQVSRAIHSNKPLVPQAKRNVLSTLAEDHGREPVGECQS